MDLDDILYEDERSDEDNIEKSISSPVKGLYSPLASEESMRISLESIRKGNAGLNKHRAAILSRIPEQNQWAIFGLNKIEDKDLAYLSAATGDEFALMRGKNNDILFHGTPLNCHLEDDELLMTLFYAHKIRLEIHSHPDFGKVTPSMEDRAFLKEIGQKESKIISSYTGKIITFSQDRFEI